MQRDRKDLRAPLWQADGASECGASARGDVEGRNATVEYHRLAVGAGLSGGMHGPGERI